MNDKKIVIIVIVIGLVFTATNIYFNSRGMDNSKQLLDRIQATENSVRETNKRIAEQIGEFGKTIAVISERIGGMEEQVSNVGQELRSLGTNISGLEKRTREINAELRSSLNLLSGITESIGNFSKSNEGFSNYLEELAKKYNILPNS